MKIVPRRRNQATDEVRQVAKHFISLIHQHESTMTEELLRRKQSLQTEVSTQMSAVDEILMDINGSLEFGKDILERNNLPEILNVEETLERRFKELLSSSEISPVPVEINYFKVGTHEGTSPCD